MSISPDSGSTTGGNTVTITGTDLTSTEQVVFGPNAVHVGGQNAAFTVISDTEIAAIAHSEAVGPADDIVASAVARSLATPTKAAPAPEHPSREDTQKPLVPRRGSWRDSRIRR